MRARKTSANGRFLTGLICLFLAAAILPATPVHAQQDDLPGVGNFFKRLFRGGQKRRETAKPAPRSSTKTTKRRKSAPAAAPASPPEPVVEKLENARKIIIAGDFLAGGMASGLTEAFADLPGVVVVDKSNGSSGFVRDDYYDWPASIGPMLDEEKPAVVVMMIGSNDRQQMRTAEGRFQPRAEEWDKAYKARVETFAQAVQARNIPLVWVGMPPFKSPSMSEDMLAFNDMYKQAAESGGGKFIDIWEGFVDENGAFVTTGPDINGQAVRLRAGDGINVTKAGRRKIAFYVEKPLKKLLGDAANPLSGPLGPDTAPAGGTVTPAALHEVKRTAPLSLSGAELDGGGQLLGAAPNPDSTAAANPLPVEKLVRDGLSAAPAPGRADDFRLPGPANPEPAAPPVPDPRKTGALAR